MLALILAGGEGSRLKLGEKGLVPVNGKAMAAHVIEAFQEAGIEPILVTSHKTPFTKNWCRANSIDFIDTAGAGYLDDLREAVIMSGEEGPLFTAACDIPCLTSTIITKVLEAYTASGNEACSTWVPVSLCDKYSTKPRYIQKIDGVPATPCALNIFLGSRVEDEQTELALLLDEPGLAFNINTREELEELQRLIEQGIL
ncbi:MAG TPA: NTP transferase domain-containing protein [Methanocorpusculum sp.]|nr:NTP transferase domain-containing protein [Methanocorpusculum sp.]